MAKKEIFLSYGREEQDIQRLVLKLKHDLEKNGFSVWLDMEDIPAGSDWHAAIGTGLHNCTALLALITNKYISSRYCASELYTADSDKKHVFPLIVEEVDFESTERGRGVKYVVSGINWVYFRQGKDDYFSSLLKLMQGMREKGLGSKDGDDDPTAAVSPLVGQMGQLQLSPQPHQYPPPSSPHYPPGLYPPTGSPHYPPTGSPHYPPTGSPHYPPTGSPHYPPTGSPHYPPVGLLPQYQLPPQYPPHFMPQYPTVSTDGPYPGYPTVSPDGGAPTAPPQYTDLYPDTPSRAPQRPPSPPPVASSDPEKGAAAARGAGPPPAPPVVSRNRLRIGLKLEADDRRFPYYVCVATIEDMRNNDIKIHFDGWGPGYDYWCSADSIEIHPMGWCRKYNWELQPPKDRPWNGWNQYLHAHQAEGADDTYFTKDQLAPPGSMCFSRGMRVEAKDRKNPHLTCVATITDIQNGHLLIHFDGWTNTYDYWCLPNSTDIHPPMWASKHSKKVEPPKGHGPFKWSSYLNEPDINPAPAHLFTQLQLGDGRVDSSRGDEFEVGMKLEAKDRLYPTLVCVATINDIRNGKLLIHFDGWNNSYDYWCEPDTMDIHPIRWCQQRGRDLQAPQGYGREFSWDTYLNEEGAQPAPLSAFTAAQK